jgi:hypothetical protein
MTQWGLDVLFNPAKRHMDEEKRRLQSTREEVGDASKGNRIDLMSGKVTIRRKSADGAEAIDAADENVAADENDAAEQNDAADVDAEVVGTDSAAQTSETNAD